MLTPLCITFLLLGPGRWTKLLALALIVGSVISAGTLGAVAATIFGLLVALIVTSTWAGRVSILGTLLIAAAVVLVIRTNWPVVSWPDDIVLTEKDGKNLRQRYVEWQAELNLLEQRAVVGTGAGCLNEYRSEFYYRLPKLNTLQAFDQNGWLATAAETGILGLVCFSWILLSYCQQVYHHLKEAESDALSADLAPTCAASLAGLAGACVTNIFSSVMYNGVLIVFVLLLVLAAKSGELSRKP
jgi:O-antigen ligase